MARCCVDCRRFLACFCLYRTFFSVGFRSRAGVNSLGVSLGGPRGHGAILRGKVRVLGVRVHRAPRVRTFVRPPPAHPVASRRREARAPRGRAPCRHNITSQQSPSCVSVSGFAAVNVRNPTGDRAIFQSEFACASSVAFSLGTQRSPRRGRVRFVWFLFARDRNHKNAISGQNLAIRAAPRVSQIPHRAKKGGHEPFPRSYTTKVPVACAR